MDEGTYYLLSSMPASANLTIRCTFFQVFLSDPSQMYIADTKTSVHDATVWIKQMPDGSFAPDESKAAKYLKWFQDGVLKHLDPGTFRLSVYCRFRYSSFVKQPSRVLRMQR